MEKTAGAGSGASGATAGGPRGLTPSPAPSTPSTPVTTTSPSVCTSSPSSSPLPSSSPSALVAGFDKSVLQVSLLLQFLAYAPTRIRRFFLLSFVYVVTILRYTWRKFVKRELRSNVDDGIQFWMAFYSRRRTINHFHDENVYLRATFFLNRFTNPRQKTILRRDDIYYYDPPFERGGVAKFSRIRLATNPL